MKQARRSIVRFLVSSSLKNETTSYEDNWFTMSTSLKNELGHEDSSFTVSTSLKNEPGTPFQFESLIRSHKIQVESFT